MSRLTPQPRWLWGVDVSVPEHRVLGGAEAAVVLADYEHRNRVVAPRLRWVLSRLIGWRYDGSENARRRLVQELPVLAFRPPDRDDVAVLSSSQLIEVAARP